MRPRGSPKTPGSGRKKGAPNKRTVELQAKLAALGCDPIAGMAKIAMGKKNTPELRGRMFAELAAYLFPKRKAVEISGEGVSPVNYTFNMGAEK